MTANIAIDRAQNASCVRAPASLLGAITSFFGSRAGKAEPVHRDSAKCTTVVGSSKRAATHWSRVRQQLAKCRVRIDRLLRRAQSGHDGIMVDTAWASHHLHHQPAPSVLRSTYCQDHRCTGQPCSQPDRCPRCVREDRGEGTGCSGLMERHTIDRREWMVPVS